LRGLNHVGEHSYGGLRGSWGTGGGSAVLGAITCGVQELLFVVFVGDIVLEGAVCDGVGNGVLGKVSASVGCGVLLKFVEFSNCLTPSFCYRPGISMRSIVWGVPVFAHYG